MDLLEQYYAETFDKKFHKDGKGIIVYSHVNDEAVYLEDMFLPKEHRAQKNGWNLIDTFVEKVKEENYKRVITSINTNIKTVTRSMAVILRYGFEYTETNGHMIYFSKEI